MTAPSWRCSTTHLRRLWWWCFHPRWKTVAEGRRTTRPAFCTTIQSVSTFYCCELVLGNGAQLRTAGLFIYNDNERARETERVEIRKLQYNPIRIRLFTSAPKVYIFPFLSLLKWAFEGPISVRKKINWARVGPAGICKPNPLGPIRKLMPFSAISQPKNPTP